MPGLFVDPVKRKCKKEILFDSYVWVTGTSETAKKYAETFYQRTVNLSGIKTNDLVVEIASNDGTFLKPFQRDGYSVIGIEPAKNIAEMAGKSGIRTFDTYWNCDSAEHIKSSFGAAQVILARNVIPHVSELHSVIEGIQRGLDFKGIGVIEFHYAGIILEELHYDSIYHEHLCYFSIQSLKHLLNKYNLFPFHIDLSPISGGSYVIYFSQDRREISREYRKLLEREDFISVNKLESWIDFGDKCRTHRNQSREILRSFGDKVVVGFGASARCSTYLNFCGFTSNDIKAIIDNNRLKQALYTAGSTIPIVSFDEGFKSKPDIIFILAWNFKDEIIKQCASRGFTGDYLIPFPHNPYFLKTEV